MDRIDRRLIGFLQTDARIPNAELARRLEMAPSAVHQRVKKLEEHGLIREYVARVDPGAVDRGLLAFIHLRTDERLADFRIAEELAAIPGVLEVHDIASEDCYLVKVRVHDTDALHGLIRHRIGAVDGVSSTRTTIVLKTICERWQIPLTENSLEE